jgi:hypothetical protein
MDRGLSPALARTFRYFFATDTRVSRDTGTHWTYLAILGFFLVAPAFLSFEPGRDAGPSIFSLRLPSMCLTHEISGFECPGCGLTRSFVLITHGRLRDSLQCHRLGILLFGFFLYQAVFRIYCLRNLGRPYSRLLLRVQCRAPAAVILLLILNWVAGIFTGSNGS